jgi:hypothetical protein
LSKDSWLTQAAGLQGEDYVNPVQAQAEERRWGWGEVWEGEDEDL